MDRTVNIKRYAILFAYAIFAIFYIWLAGQVPYTHDDWDWGLSIGMEQMLTGCINGRYAGNFVEVVMTRSAFLKTVFMGGCYFLIPFTVSSIATVGLKENRAYRRVAYFVLCSIFLLLMKRTMWQQTYGWIAGFANFAVSGLFLLLLLKEGLCVFDDIDLSANRWNLKCVFLLVLGIISQLFLENVAVFLVIFCVAVNGIYWKRTGALSKAYLLLLLGTLIGLCIIFSSSIYGQLWATGDAVDGYRQVHLNANSSLASVARECLYQAAYLLYELMGNCMLPYGCILVLLNAVFVISQKHRKTFRILCILLNCCFVVLFASHYFFGSLANLWVRVGVAILFNLLMAGELVLLFHSKKTLMCKLVMVWVSVLAVIAPLVITTERGHRLFLTPYVLLALFAIMLLQSLTERIPKKICNWGLICGVAVAVVLIGFYGKIYYDIGVCKDQRNEIIAQAVESGAEEIVLPGYPHPDFLWQPDPYGSMRNRYFKEFYGIAQDVTVIVETAD